MRHEASTSIRTTALRTVRLPRMTLPACGWKMPSKKGVQPEIPAAIKEAMVLWYDVSRQGCTNESMAADPRLIDLSGNNRHAECRNFAWSGMSGIGGYECNNFDSFRFHPQSGSETQTQGVYAKKISAFEINVFNKIYSKLGIGSWYTNNNKFRCKIFVSGIKENQQLFVCQYGNTYNSQELYNGDNDVTIDFTGNEDPDYKYATFYTGNASNDEYNITIKLLPLYPNALVSDGVDDNCLCSGLPILTIDKGYTIIAAREIFRDSITTGNKDLASNCGSGSDWQSGGNMAFHFEYAFAGELYTTSSFRQLLNLSHFGGIEAGRVSWQTDVSYNGIPFDKSLAKSDKGNPHLVLFQSIPSSKGSLPAALWSFLLFDRTLTAEEIGWVKDNLLATTGETR